jgi:Xaa-Pro aminopeptidase
MNHRLIELCSNISEAGMDAALLLHPRDVLYYAGTVRPASLLVVPEPPQAVLFVRRGLEYARREVIVDHVQPMDGFSSITEAVAALDLDSGVLGVDLDAISATLYQRLMEVFSGWELVDVSPLVLDQRAVKEADEIEATRQAAAAADAGHSVVPQVAAPGVSELELAAEIEHAMRRAGHEGYQPLRHPGGRGGGVLLMSGEHLAVRGGHGLVVTGVGLSAGSPYGPSRRVLQPGDLVVVDIGSTCGGYTADESRTFVVGRGDEQQRALFSVALRAENAVLDAACAGAPIADLCAAVEAVVDQGVLPFFAPGSLTLPGFIGHGIGLELDEPPVLWPGDKTLLREGMVLAVEIEVSAPDPCMMVKLEDTVVVRAEGCEVLTKAPRELMTCGL